MKEFSQMSANVVVWFKREMNTQFSFQYVANHNNESNVWKNATLFMYSYKQTNGLLKAINNRMFTNITFERNDYRIMNHRFVMIVLSTRWFWV